jgi:pyridoxamine 5'-phosphate oxidase
MLPARFSSPETPPDWGEADPHRRFEELLARAGSIESRAARAAALATVDARGQPSVRMVVLAGHDARGFAFFTSYSSRKGRELSGNPRAALCFYWPEIAVQVRIEGEVERLSAEESDAEFGTRPRAQQVAAWAWCQSAPLPSRRRLLEEVREVDGRFVGQPVSRPPDWGGYRLRPERIEFWHGFENRLHDRILHVREGAGWRVERLSP